MKSPKSKSGASGGGNKGRAASAHSAGMSSMFGPQQTVMDCPGSPSQTPYWASILYPVDPGEQTMGPVAHKPIPTVPCDVSTLKLAIVSSGKTHNISLGSQRRREAVAANVPGDYRYKLQHKDLIVEVIAPVKETTTTYGWKKEPVTKASKGHEPVKITASATPASSCGQTHPSLSANGGNINKTSARQPVKFDVFAPAPSTIVGASSWGRLWPFGDSRSEEITVIADSCGYVPGGKATKDLSVLLVALPDESWKITLGLGSYMSGSISKKKKHSTGPDKKQTGIVTTKKRQIAHERVESNEIQIADTHFSESFSYSQTSGVLLQKTHSLVEKDSSWDKPSFEEERERNLRKIKIERTVGGRKTETNFSEIVNGILDTIEAIRKLEKVFDGIPKIGWSMDASFSFLTGQAVLEWGYRWPRSFSENQRVYYAERFITLGGEVELAAASVEAMFGVEVDPWWAPFYFVAKFYLEISASLSISPSGTLSFTNWHDNDLDLNPMDLDAKAQIKAKLGGTAGGRIVGYELRAEIRLESSLTFDIDGKISRKGPEAKCSLISDGAKIVGEIIEVGFAGETHQFDPIVVMKPKDILKDKVIL